MPKLMIHWNNLIPVAIFIKTTGPDSTKHDIMELAVIAMDGHLKQAPDILPFEMKLRVERYENFDPKFVSYKKMIENMTNPDSFDPLDAADRFDKWFDYLGLRERKKILPVAYNYADIAPFLRFWLGPLNFDHMFDYRYRDILSLANAMNDAAAIRHHEAVFEKIDFPYICNVLGVSRGTKTCMELAHAVIMCYREMLSVRWANSMYKRKEEETD